MQPREYSPIPHIAATADLKKAARQVGEGDLRSLWLDWPSLQEASRNMARYTGGLLLPGAERPMLIEALDSGLKGYRAANETQSPVAGFIHGVCDVMTSLMTIEVIGHDGHVWKRWKPLSMHLAEFLENPLLTTLRIGLDEDAPIFESPEARIVIASRIFSIHELELSGLIPRSKSQ